MDNTIHRLTVSERVRLRPAVVFGSSDLEGSKHVFTDWLKILLAQARRSCARIDIKLHKDGTIELKTDGKGFYIGTDQEHWRKIFCELPYKRYNDIPRDGLAFSLYTEDSREGSSEALFYDDLSLPACTFVCEHLTCWVWRVGFFHEIRFLKGEAVGKTTSPCDRQRQGMHLLFRIDSTVFDEVRLPLAFVQEVASTAATRLPIVISVAFATEDEERKEEIYGAEQPADFTW